MANDGAIAPRHPAARIAKLPDYARRLRIESDQLESLIRVELRNYDSRRFQIMLKFSDIASDDGPEKYAVVAYSVGGGVRIGSNIVAPNWGRGSGIAVVRKRDLAQLAALTLCAATLEFYLGHWIGYPDEEPSRRTAGTARNGMKFRYYSSRTRN